VSEELGICRLGLLDYEEAAALQEQLRDAVRAGALPELLLLLEHPPVYTRGRRSEPGELPLGEAWYRSRGIEIVQTRRGGKVTYHGPGQLVGYPIMRVENAKDYVCTMQHALAAALRDTGVDAGVRDGWEFTGAWVADRKIASIGVHVSRGVSTHGFAVNVDNDLQPFEWIVPCGLGDVRMTSVCAETGKAGSLHVFTERAVERFAEAFGRTPVDIAPERLQSVLTAA
jgi:lipoyl(octanoyl) transferase